MESNDPLWIPVKPPFEENAQANNLFLLLVAELEECARDRDSEYPPGLAHCRERAMAIATRAGGLLYQQVKLVLSIVCDLLEQGWAIQINVGRLFIRRPNRSGVREVERDRVRRALSLSRDEQLSEAPVREFIRSMEVRRLTESGWTSIFSLMRDGKSLADDLSRCASIDDSLRRLEALRSTIRPYLQFVGEDERCERTGFKLADIWRYFRYTWLTPARSTPGRTMAILIRDAAVEPHPVIGIAALASSIVQQHERDSIIGWDAASVLAEIENEPTARLAEWLMSSFREMVSAIYHEDLVSRKEMQEPTADIVKRLVVRGESEKRLHQLHARNLEYRQKQNASRWSDLARSHLYTSKRALTLADMLRVSIDFGAAGFITGTADELRTAAHDPRFLRAVPRLVRSIKASHVGINMMDISIAGAIAPYSAILGGKLVSLLMTSPEVRKEYARRYGSNPSVIASAMKGEAVIRTPELVLLCTTGIFGGGSSQYNRLRFSAREVCSGRGEIRFRKLERQTTFATFHISQATMRELETFSHQWHDGPTVHGIFGEGVNPQMRKLREGLLRAGFPPEKILQAGTPRAVYMIPLAHNYQDILLGRSNEPEYILSQPDPNLGSENIIDYWRSRWLSGRISQQSIIGEVSKHSNRFPMMHGACVRLPDGIDNNDEDNPTIDFDENHEFGDD